jgi:hypothetical protein
MNWPADQPSRSDGDAVQIEVAAKALRGFHLLSRRSSYTKFDDHVAYDQAQEMSG